MKAILRRERSGVIPMPIILVVVIVAVLGLVVALYAFGVFNPPEGSGCPLSVCGIGDTKVWIRVDVKGSIEPVTGSSPRFASGSPRVTAVLTTRPMSLMHPPQFILDETSSINGRLTVTYPKGTSFSYDLPEQSGINYWNFDVYYFIEGPTGLYQFTAVVSLWQTGCWLGCAPAIQVTASTSFTA